MYSPARVQAMHDRIVRATDKYLTTLESHAEAAADCLDSQAAELIAERIAQVEARTEVCLEELAQIAKVKFMPHQLDMHEIRVSDALRGLSSGVLMAAFAEV